MMFVPVRRNPSTTIGAGPASHTVAPKSRRSRPGASYSSTEIPQAGSATRSGRVLGRGLVFVGSVLPSDVLAVSRADAGAQYGGQPVGLVITSMPSVADAPAGAMEKRSRYIGVIWTCAEYVPSGPPKRMRDMSSAPTAHP